MKNQFAVFGNPIEHSLSPQIHQQFASQQQLDISYEKILSDESRFANDIEDFFASGGSGCNVTMPFKQQAFKLCKELTQAASRAQAVNTLYKNNSGQICGHNTDGSGLLHDLTKNLQLSLKNSNIIIVGAGGATRGILEPLISQAPASLTLINRTLKKAETLADEFSDLFSIRAVATDNIPTYVNAADLIINATSASLNAKLPISENRLICAKSVSYDLAYASEPTPFLNWSKSCGCNKNHDGRGMLVEQAALAFQQWTSHTPDTASMIKNFEELKAQ